VAALTDWLDGYLARALGQTSAFGAFLDPVADKLMVAAALIVLIDLDRVATPIGLIIIGREHHFRPARMDGQGGERPAWRSFVGKLKTTAQMIAIDGWYLTGRWPAHPGPRHAADLGPRCSPWCRWRITS
jgi:CDP-diacylglycerol--glycerol-3-phosphate 3-phosphatidyltransferase/cardiolipin synthase